ncbi:MAG: lipopolysaccharide biosynthesis protein [Solirubrobacterales bacterium]|nr:lipopolysaccharide biosynthesis protein [Solirubrobacterales bacterium]
MRGEEVDTEPAEQLAGPDAAANVLGRGSRYTVATLIQVVAGILIIPLLTRTVDPEEYGTITAALVVQTVFGTAAAVGCQASISRTYFRRHGPEGARALIGVTALAAVAFAVLAELTGPLWSGVFEGLDYGAPLRLAVLQVVPVAVLVGAVTFLQAAGRVRAYVITVALATPGAQGLGLVVALLHGGAVGYLAGVTAGLYVAMIFAWLAAVIDFGPLRPRSGGRDLLRGAAWVALPTIPSSLALYVLSAGDRIVVEGLEGLSAAGAYYIAYAVGSLGIFLVTALNNAWGPILFGTEEETRWSLMADSAVEVTRVVALVGAALAIGAPIALELFAPSDYDLAGLGTVSALVAVSGLPYLWYITSYNIVVWRGRTGILGLATPICVAVNLGLCALLIPPLGLEGAALATLIAYGLLAFLTWLRSRSLAPVPWDLRALSLAASPAIGGLAIALALPDHGAWLVIRGLVAAGLGLYGLALLTASHRIGVRRPAASAT